jgi:cobalt-zinc-cadmium efflux system outer membrane protein
MSSHRWRLRALGAAALLAAAGVRPAVADPVPPFAALLAQARATAPRLLEAEAAVRRAEGLATQSAVRPNPTANLAMENFAGGRPFDGVSNADVTLSVGQEIEFGGKRQARIAAGSAEVVAAKARLAEAEAAYAYDLAVAYLDAEVAARRAGLAEETLALAREDERSAKALVEAGRDAELRGVQAAAATAAAEAGLQAARAEVAATLTRLSALAGGRAVFTDLTPRLLVRSGAAAAARAVDVLSTPAVRTAEAEREAAARRVRIEQARRTPEVTVSVGVRRLGMENATALIAGVSAPLPVFDRNRGAVSAAQAERSAAEARLAAARLDAEAEAKVGTGRLAAAGAQLAAARGGEAAAEEAYRLSRLGYEGGKLPLAEVLTARRGLAEARTRTLDAQLARLRAEAGLARLQGRAPFGDN